MRYELRRWTDQSRSSFVIRQKSDDYSAINQQFNRAFFASSEPNLLHIEVPYVIRALVGNKVRALYESQAITVPLLYKQVHKITETKSIRLEEEAW